MSHPVLPLALAAFAMFVLTAMDGVVKALAERHSAFDIVTMRYAAGALWALALAAVMRPALPGLALIRIHAARATISVFSAGLFFYGISKLPFAEAVAIGFLSPAVTALLARVFLGEVAGPMTLASMAVSFCGVLVIAFDRANAGAAASGDLLGVAAVLLSVLAYAASLVLLRARAQKDEMAVIVLLTNVFAALYLIAASLVVSRPAEVFASDWGMFLLIGGLGALGHVFLSMAYARADAARVVAVDYTGYLWALLIGLVYFHEWPSRTSLGGAALIILGSGLLLLRKKSAPTLLEE